MTASSILQLLLSWSFLSLSPQNLDALSANTNTYPYQVPAVHNLPGVSVPPGEYNFTSLYIRSLQFLVSDPSTLYYIYHDSSQYLHYLSLIYVQVLRTSPTWAPTSPPSLTSPFRCSEHLYVRTCSMILLCSVIHALVQLPKIRIHTHYTVAVFYLLVLSLLSYPGLGIDTSPGGTRLSPWLHTGHYRKLCLWHE